MARARRRQPRPRPARRGPTKEPRATILVVCEGERTEPNYFKSLKKDLALSNAEVEIVKSGGASAPISVVSRAVELRKIRARDSTMVDYDEIWCVMDVEVPKHRSLPKALNRARDQKLDVAISNPCFEFWILLHFERCGAPQHGFTAVAKRLKRHIRKYEKGQDVFLLLKPNTDQAIKRSEQLWVSQWNTEEDPCKCNPCTTVHKLVQRLQEVAAKG